MRKHNVMNTAKYEKLILTEVKGLSEEALSEVLNFIQFLKQKVGKIKSDRYEKKASKSLTRLGKSELSHVEEEFANYKKLYPREK
jgi:hypothetical protein